jgi:hypothetical protein
MAETKTEVDGAESFLDHCTEALNRGELTAADAAEAKW